MQRRLLNLLTGLSLLLCVAVVALWVRSYTAEHGVEFGVRGVRWELASARGVLRLDNEPQRAFERELFRASVGRDMELLRRLEERTADLPAGPTQGGDSESRRQALRDELQTVRLRLIDANNRQAAVPSTAYVQFSIPHGVAAASVAVPVVAWAAAALYARRRRVRKLGLCPSCGYDLRASPDRCPECGETASGGDLR